MPVINNQTIHTYQVKLTTAQPISIGALKDPMSDIDSPVVTVGGRIAIPGSSLKGALRAQLEEYLILNYGSEESMKPCIPAMYANLSQDERRLIEERKYKGPNCGYGIQRGRPVQICPACYLFGTAGLVGFVQVPYLYADVDAEEGYAARRDRATNTVASGANRSLQLLAPGTVFRGTLSVLVKDDIRGWELGKPRALRIRDHADAWLRGKGRSPEDIINEFVIDRLKSVWRVGGKYSVGMGQVTIEVTPSQAVMV